MKLYNTVQKIFFWHKTCKSKNLIKKPRHLPQGAPKSNPGLDRFEVGGQRLEVQQLVQTPPLQGGNPRPQDCLNHLKRLRKGFPPAPNAPRNHHRHRDNRGLLPGDGSGNDDGGVREYEGVVLHG